MLQYGSPMASNWPVLGASQRRQIWVGRAVTFVTAGCGLAWLPMIAASSKGHLAMMELEVVMWQCLREGVHKCGEECEIINNDTLVCERILQHLNRFENDLLPYWMLLTGLGNWLYAILDCAAEEWCCWILLHVASIWANIHVFNTETVQNCWQIQTNIEHSYNFRHIPFQYRI